MSFASRLKEARRNKGFTQEELGRLVGVAKTTITGYEKGTSHPDEGKIIKLMDVLCVDANYLWQDDVKIVDSRQTLSFNAHRIGLLYDRADDHARDIVELTLKPFDDGRAIPRNKLMAEFSDELSPYPLRSVPLHALPASAGLGEFLDSEDFELVEVGPEVPASANFGVRISGDSMEPRFPNGHVAWVKRTSSINDGEIGVFIVNGEGFIKRQERGKLVSLNPAYDPIILDAEDNVRTCGLVVGVT